MEISWDKFDTIAVVSALMVFSGVVIYKNGFEILGPILPFVGFFVLFVDAGIVGIERMRDVIKE